MAEPRRIVTPEEAARLAMRGELPVVDGPRLETFDPLLLARALEQECARARQVGWPKISISMDVEDALKLALTLRKGR